MGQEVHLRKYGVATTVDFELFEVDGVDFRVDAVHAAGDTVIMKNEGAEANTTNGFVDEGRGYSIAPTATEMEAARIVIYVVDQTATKVWLDKTIKIETYGHPNAQHAFDLDDSVRGGMTALPNAAAEAAGGLFTRGTGAGQINQDANGRIDSNPVALGGTVQSLTDLKDFADQGYDPAANKVEGVKTTDAATDVTNAVSITTAAALSVWHVLESTILTAATIGLKVKNNLDALISSRAAPGDAMALTTAERNTIVRRIMPQSNAARNNFKFLMLDSTTKNPATGLTVSGTRIIDDSAEVAVAGTIAELSSGAYQFDAAAADMNGKDIMFEFTATGADSTFINVITDL